MQVGAPPAAAAPAAARAQSFPPQAGIKNDELNQPGNARSGNGARNASPGNGPNQTAGSSESQEPESANKPTAGAAGAASASGDSQSKQTNGDTDITSAISADEAEKVVVGASVDPESDRVMAGRLEKQGEGVSAAWSLRYLVVGGRECRYFADEAAYEAGAAPVKDRVLQLDRHAAIGDDEPIDDGKWVLRLVPVVAPPGEDGRVTPGVVVSSDGRTLRSFVFRAPTRKARDDWVHVLQSHGAKGQEALDALAAGESGEGGAGEDEDAGAGAGGTVAPHESVSSQAKAVSGSESSHPVMVGTLEKKGEGAMAGWISRFVVLDQQVLRYYKTEAQFNSGSNPIKGRALSMPKHAVVRDPAYPRIFRIVPAIPAPKPGLPAPEGTVATSDGRSLR